MASNRTHDDFRETSWSLLGELRADEPERRRAAMSTLFETYQGPVYAYLRQLGCSAEHASELTQRFFVDKVLHGGLFDKADKRRARLRVLLRTSLKRFRIDDYRRRAVRGGHPVPSTQLEREEHVLPGAPGGLSPDEAFQRRWASVVLEEALRRCRERYTARGRSAAWEAFYARTVRPILSGARPRSQAAIAKEVGLASASEVSQAVFEIRRRLQVVMLEVVSDTVTDPNAARQELDELLQTLRAA
jgi:DNA-directed RNA polymerase specialized sigma24 family protein